MGHLPVKSCSVSFAWRVPDALSALIIEKFHKIPALLLCLIMLVIMFPGMITGSSTAAVLTAGSIMSPVLIADWAG